MRVCVCVRLCGVCSHFAIICYKQRRWRRWRQRSRFDRPPSQNMRAQQTTSQSQYVFASDDGVGRMYSFAQCPTTHNGTNDARCVTKLALCVCVCVVICPGSKTTPQKRCQTTAREWTHRKPNRWSQRRYSSNVERVAHGNHRHICNSNSVVQFACACIHTISYSNNSGNNTIIAICTTNPVH